MPRKTIKPETEVEFVPMEDADVEAVLEQVGSTSKYIALTRRNPTTKDHDYVGRYDLPIDNLLDHVKEDHGGGKYTGRICGQGGAYLKGVTFSIDSRFRPTMVPPPTLAVASATPPSSDLGEIRSMLKELIAFQIQMMNTPKHDPLDVGLRIAEAMRGGAPVSTPSPPPTSFAEMFSIFKQGMELGQAASGGEGMGYLPVIEKLGGPLVEALGKMASRPNPTVTKAHGGPALKSPTPQTPDQYLASYLPQIISLALSKKDPILYADVVLDQVPEAQYDYLYGVVSRSDVIPYLSSLHPGVKEHEAWFLEFTKTIKESLTPEVEKTEPRDIPSFTPEDMDTHE